MALAPLLPKKFLGVLPLYTGVELILLYAIINRMSGIYGLLSLITGHPIDFMQWIFYVFSTIALVFYIMGIRQVRSPSMNSFSLVVFVYLLDSVIGCFFTLHFVWVWFAEQSQDTTGELSGDNGTTKSVAGANTDGGELSSDASLDSESLGKDGNVLLASKAAAKGVAAHLVKRVAEDLDSHSASESYELFLTIALTLGTTLIRIYFTMIVLSFFKQLVLASKFDSRFRLSTSVNSGSKFSNLMTKLELKAYSILNRIV